ncbi:hypothetical protein DPMN_069049 [Dreissena polymorpha]|uniref:Uncharacterized protein n=1 Tax=Dreissena polymorpha TaxID=45954 RepID=A0A9D3Z2R6_DREPO|nr:hypothetical protein DPMN_069049 [Dreissena polymorpha]
MERGDPLPPPPPPSLNPGQLSVSLPQFPSLNPLVECAPTPTFSKPRSVECAPAPPPSLNPFN